MANLTRALLLLIVGALANKNHVQCEWDSRPYFDLTEQVEKRYSSELLAEFQSVQEDALLLYTEFSANSGANYKKFITNLNDVVHQNYGDSENIAAEPCRSAFQQQLLKIKAIAYKAASYSADNHHRFFLGPMTVFRMHLNKTEAYLRRTKRNLQNCGIACETAPNVMRWRKLAAVEINRVKSDMVNVRPIYRDILVHFKHRLNRIWKATETKLQEASTTLQKCQG